MAKQRRPAVPHATQAAIFFRDGWLCHICKRPVIFNLSLRYLAVFTAENGVARSLAYWDSHWRRDASPLLDELAASIDHVIAFAKGGAHDEENFATICARCNARKSTRSRDDYIAANPPWQVRGRYGEPINWDGLSMAFVALVTGRLHQLTRDERAWFAVLQPYARAEARVLGPS